MTNGRPHSTIRTVLFGRTVSIARTALGSIALAAGVMLIACQNPFTAITTQRTLSFDVASALFGSPTDPNPGKQGPGIDSITVTVTVTTSGQSSTLPAQTFAGSSITPGAPYGNFTMPVSGQLKDIAVTGTLAGATVVSADVSDVSSGDVSRYGNWSGFANVTYFKIDWSGGPAATGTIRVLPCPRSAATLLADAGVQTGAGNTDLASSLQTTQVALELVPAEYDGAGDLTYDFYYAVADVDPSITYNDAQLANTYLAHPWTAQWTYAEVTGSSGKTIGSTTYVMTKWPGGPFTAGKPDANGKYAILLDLSRTPNVRVGKYLLYCAVLTRGTLSVPTDVGVIEIQ